VVKKNLLHVYAQDEVRDPVAIVGDRESLQSFKEELDRTLRGLDGELLSHVVDGEGFNVHFLLVADGDVFPLREGSTIFEGCTRPMHTNVLHVHGQESWHSESIVVGDREAFGRLRAAVERALQDGEASFSPFASADDKFEVLVKLAEKAELLRALPLPYRAEYAGGCTGRSRAVVQLVRKERSDVHNVGD
jgi:hypothetical protein